MGRNVVKSAGKRKKKSRGRLKTASQSGTRRGSRSASSRGRARSASSKRRSRSGSSRRSRAKSRGSYSTGHGIRSADKCRLGSFAESQRDLDAAAGAFPLRLLTEGESILIDRRISELDITLYRPLPEEGNAPLFFDTTVCLLSDHEGQTDYVGVGRATTNNKGLEHKPHAVLRVDADCTGSKNFLEPSGGTPVIAGDGVFVDLKKLAMWGGFSLCATLFTADTKHGEITDVYYAVKTPRSRVPLVIVPVTLGDSSQNSCIAFMVRKVKGNSKSIWEILRIGETFSKQDVKGVLGVLKSRGLVNPANYRLLPYHGLDESLGNYNEDNLSNEDEEDYSDDDMSVSICNGSDTFESLLADVPRVAREGRRQYTAGRSVMNTVVEAADSSDEDEVMEDALRAVVPRYTSLCPVRYEEKTYNVGSRDEVLAEHYVSHREEYGLENAESQLLKTSDLPPIFSLSNGALHRLSYGTNGIPRPSAPNELLASLPSVLRGRCGTARWGHSSSSSRKFSAVRGRSKSIRRRKGKGKKKGKKKGRGSRSRGSRSRRSGSNRKRSIASRGQLASSSRRKSRNVSATRNVAVVDAINGNNGEG